MKEIGTDDIRALAGVLGSLTPTSDSVARYDAMSDAVVWTDELPVHRPPHEWWALRTLLRHRSLMILQQPSVYQACWLEGLTSFPNWPGFLPERCNPSEQLKRILEDGRQAWLRAEAEFPD